GEGGFVTTSDDEMAAKAIYLSGAYEGRYCGQDNGGRGSRVDRCAGTARTGRRGRGSPQLPIEESFGRGQSLF
ncbi:unnamed protein product, partial [Ectocarpus sp. 8 AP-2014]